MIWFTGDTHFGHANIIRYCNRPFNSVAEMDEIIIKNLNDSVQKRDTLYHLGDFCFGRPDPVATAKQYLDRINCKNIILITGNHDPHYANGYPRREFASLFRQCYPILRIKVNEPTVGLYKHQIVLCHYAMRVWDKSHYGSWNLFGHSHSTLPDMPNTLSLDVGVDAVASMYDRTQNSYRPISIVEVTELMRNKVIN